MVIFRAFGGKIIPDTSMGGLLYIKSWKHKGPVSTVWVRLLVFLLTVKTYKQAPGFISHIMKNKIGMIGLYILRLQ